MRFTKLLGCLSLPLAFVAVFAAGTKLSAEPADVGPLVKQVLAVGPKGAGHREAIAAIGQLSKADAEQLPEILAAMNDANPLSMNWLRVTVEAVAQRTLADGGKLPVEMLEQFLADTANEPRSRRLAYELILRADSGAEKRLVPGFLNDPSLELRRDAVAMKLDKAESSLKGNEKQAAIENFREALTAARDLAQIKTASDRLRELGQAVDLPSHFGFVMRWQLIGPFDNTGKSGFDVSYPPEKTVELDGQYKGGAAELQSDLKVDGLTLERLRWFPHTTNDEHGLVDLNAALGKCKGAIVYAYTEFVADKQQDAELRMGTANGNKIWLNGKLIADNEVYHARMELDQYVGRGQLKKGTNQILVKICQNEQTEDWAQRWDFQLRVCDKNGTAILSLDRPEPKETGTE